MAQDDPGFVKGFFRSVSIGELEPEAPEYVCLYEERELFEFDPVKLLARGIQWTAGQSIQLFSGFRGTGKSTELRRLRKELRESSYLVVLLDIEDHLSTSEPIEIADFLMALAGAFGEALAAPELLGKDATREGYWDRFAAFLARTRIELGEVGAAAKGVEIKANLRSDPTFRQDLQKKLAGHLGTFVQEVSSYFGECLTRLQAKHGSTKEVVLIVDSIEHIRGTSDNSATVQSSIETLFAGHVEKLHLPIHVIYTIPPYLKVRYPNLSALYAPAGVQVLPALKLKSREDGVPFEPGLRAMERVVARRGDWERLLGSRAELRKLIAASGGHLRELLRLLGEVLRRSDQLPVPPRVVEAAIDQLRNEYLPIADRDAEWLVKIAETHDANLAEVSVLPDFARFLDTHQVLCYRNGAEWYDVHPLIVDEVRQQVRRNRTEAEERQRRARDPHAGS